jgi:hypothetical protein
MVAFGAGRIEGDRIENGALLDQAGEGAMAGNARRLPRPGQGAHRCAFLDRQQLLQGLGLRRSIEDAATKRSITEGPGARILRRRSSPIRASATAMVSAVPRVTGSSQVNNSRLCSGATMAKPNAVRSASSCLRRV